MGYSSEEEDRYGTYDEPYKKEEDELMDVLSDEFPAEKGFVLGPKGDGYKFIVLFFISMVCFGSYYAYDEISPLQTDMIKTDACDGQTFCSSSQFGQLYSFYSWPNTVLVFFGGVFGDVMGYRLAGVVLGTITLLGVTMVALGGTFCSGFYLMLTGRVVFGIGNESLNVVQASMSMFWFRGTKWLSMAFGVVLTLNRIADFLAISTSANWADWLGSWQAALWVGFSWACLLVYCFLDVLAEKQNPQRKMLAAKLNSEKKTLKIILMSILQSFKNVYRYDVRVWFLAVIVAFYYAGVLPFNAQSPSFLQETYSISSTKAGHYASIVTLLPIFFAAIAGKFFDFVGLRPYFVVLGSLLIVTGHSWLLAATYYLNNHAAEVCDAPLWTNPIAPLVLVSLSYSFVPGALWPSIPLVVDVGDIATAMGITTAIQNIMLAVQNLVVGYINAANKLGVDTRQPCDDPNASAAPTSSQYNYDYSWSLFLFLVVDVIALLFGIGLIVVDHFKGRTLCIKAGAENKDNDGESAGLLQKDDSKKYDDDPFI